MKQQRRYKEPQDTLWGKFLSGFMAVVFAMSTLTLIPIASAINGEPNEAQIQQQEELADQTSGKDEKADEPAADEQKLEPVELLSIASVEDEDDADDATPADVTLKVKAQNATVTYNGKDAAIELVVPADKDVKFTVKAADGFTLGAAAVKLADAKGETTLTPNAGEYTVAADRVADGATIVVTAEAVAGSANTDAAKPSTSAPSTELGEKANKVKNAISNFIEKLGGATTFAAVGNGNRNNSGAGSYATDINITGWTLERLTKEYPNAVIHETAVKSGGKIRLEGTDDSKNDHVWRSTNSNVQIEDNTNAKNTITASEAIGATTYVLHMAPSGICDIFVVSIVEKVKDYTIQYVDGVDGEEVFADQSYTVEAGKFTPAFEGTPERTGYEFTGWNPAVAETVTDDVIYVAQWKPIATETSYTVKHVVAGVEQTADTKTYTSTSTDIPAMIAIVTGSLDQNTYPGYKFDSISVAEGTTKVESGTTITLTYVKDDSQANDLAYTVKHVVDGEDAPRATFTGEAKGVWVNDPQTLELKAADVADQKYAGYKLSTVKLADGTDVTAGTQVANGAEVTVTYVKDSFPYTVNYVDEDGNTLLDPKTGAPQEFESVISSSDEVIAIEGYIFERANTEQLTIGANADDNVITLTYAVDVITDPNNDGNGENPGDGIPDKYQAVVNYVSANNAQGTVNLAQKVVTFANNATSGTVNIFDGVATNPTAGFVFDGWTEDGNAVASNLTRELQGNTEYTFTANWALDVIGTDPTDPGNNVPDGIADKYQLVVTYAAIAGTIDGPARYVLNKYDAAGNLAEDGVAVLTAAQIPGATADDGYGNGMWNNEPLANMELTDDTAFVIAFTALPTATPDATPAPAAAAPLAPVAAAAPAAAAAAAATILDDGVPLATIDDDENALAAFEEIHCWTHWLMIFGALVTIVYGLAVLYRRRHGIRDMDDFEGDIMDGRKYDAATEKNPAAGNAFQAM